MDLLGPQDLGVDEGPQCIPSPQAQAHPHLHGAYLRSRFHFIMLQCPKIMAPMPSANML